MKDKVSGLNKNRNENWKYKGLKRNSNKTTETNLMLYNRQHRTMKNFKVSV